jgi:hypothetical protein
LRLTESSPVDVDPETPSLSFYGAEYVSRYLVFTPIEVADTLGLPLMHTPSYIVQLVKRFDVHRYVPSASRSVQPIPFVDLDNRFISAGAPPGFPIGDLHGQTQLEIADLLHHTTSAVGRAVDGDADFWIAAICAVLASARPPVCETKASTLARQRISAEPSVG